MDWTELANKHRRGDGLPKMIREPSPSDLAFFFITYLCPPCSLRFSLAAG